MDITFRTGTSDILQLLKYVSEGNRKEMASADLLAIKCSDEPDSE
jgi:hypothetical protein